MSDGRFTRGMAVGICLGMMFGSVGGALAWSASQGGGMLGIPPVAVLSLSTGENGAIACGGSNLRRIVAPVAANDTGILACE